MSEVENLADKVLQEAEAAGHLAPLARGPVIQLPLQHASKQRQTWLLSLHGSIY